MGKIYYNYHKHDYYGNIVVHDSVTGIEEYCKRAIELGHDSVFTTNHGYQGFVFEWMNAAEKYNLKVIEGAEVYYVNDINEKIRKSNHLVIIAMNDDGAQQLNKMLSVAWKKGHYYKPRVDHDMLFSLNPDNFVITTACIGGMWKDVRFIIEAYNYFGSNFFLEVQDHNDNTQRKVNKFLLEIHNKLGIPIIHGNDSHYIHENDSKYRDLYIRDKRKTSSREKDDGDYGQQAMEDNFILDYPDYDTIVERYKKQGVLSDKEISEALENTLIFQNAEPITHLNKNIKLPSIVDNSKEELRRIIVDAWHKEKKNIPEYLHGKYVKEIVKEIKSVEDCNMSAYFVDDYYISKVAKEKYGGILTKTGRGSAVSFYINKLLGLTNIDRISSPITLFPSRFMSATRILKSHSLPDIDLNMNDQEPFINATYDLLGKENCKWMLSFKPLQNSSAFRLYCRAIGMDIHEYDDIAKDIDSHRNDKKWSDIIKESEHFVGVITSISVSPCSMLLFDKPVDEEMGTLTIRSKNKDTNAMETHECCILDGYNCDRWKYLKNDYLKVEVINIIAETCRKANIDIPTIDELNKLVAKDDKTWEVYSKGLTCTINQADSDFGRQCAMRYKPHSVQDMSAFVAILRPGCSPLRDDFLDRKPYTTGVTELDNLLEDGSSRMIYQELIMKYLIWLGIEETETYTIIKKISKKKFTHEELEELKKSLMEGWIRQVGREDGFDETFAVVESAARYSFNASHSLSYAYDSIYGAYLKSHYPLEYYATVLESYRDDIDRTEKLINELKYYGIALKPIEFGYSRAEYSYDKETMSIYKGIKSIKDMNVQIANQLYELANSNEYDDFVDLLYDIKNNTDVKKNQLDILVRLNFFRKFGGNKYLLNVVDIFNKLWKSSVIKKDKIDELGISISTVRRYSEKETEKQFRGIDNKGLIKHIVLRMDRDEKLDMISQLKAEKNSMGYCEYKDETVSDSYWVVVSELKGNMYKPSFYMRHIRTGDEMFVKIRSGFKDNPVDKFSLLSVKDIVKMPKYKLVDGKWTESDELENVLNEYKTLLY